MQIQHVGRAVLAARAMNPDDAARACLFSVLDRFNTEDPFWGSFVPELDSTKLGEGRFSVTLRSGDVRIEVHGVMLVDASKPSDITPSIVVGAIAPEGTQTRRWHPVTCTVGESGRFVTSNFRRAIEAAIADLAHP